MSAVAAKARFKTAFRAWAGSDLERFVYVGKVTLASLLAMAVCIEANLTMPQTAIFTVFIVMQPQSGMVFSKSFYRFAGTCIGIVISIFLMDAFSQERAEFIILLAVWIGICSAVGFKYRNFMSYGFVLSGYTAAIVCLPTLPMPLNVFGFAVERFSEVSIGLLCSSIISESLFPKTLSSSLFANEKARFRSVMETLTESSNIFDEETNRFHYSKDILGPDALRINSAFETNIDKKDKIYFQRLNSEFMHLCTSYFSLKNIVQTLKEQGKENLIASVRELYHPIARTLEQRHSKKEIANGSLEEMIKDVKGIQRELKKHIQENKEQLHLTHFNDINDFNAMTTLIARLLHEFILYLSTYASFSKRDQKSYESFARPIKFSTHTDSVLLLLSVLRGSGVFVLMMLFWIFTGWEYGSFSVIAAVAATLLLGSAPHPLDAVNNFLKGAFLSFFVTGVYDLYMIPTYVSDMQTFCLVLTPLLAFTAWMMTVPGKGLFAFGFILMFITVCSMNLQYRMNLNVYIDTSLATIIGLMGAGAAFILVNSWSDSWNKKRVSKLLSGRIASLPTTKLAHQRVRLESSGFDLVQRFSTLGKLNSSSSGQLFKWLLSTLEIGRAIIEIRTNLGYFEAKKVKKVYLLLNIIRKLFNEKDKSDKQSLIEKFEKNFIELSRARYSLANEQKAMHHILLELSIIHTIIKNKISLPIQGVDRWH